MSSIHFICPICKANLNAPLAMAGAKSTCRQCGQRIQIPPPSQSTQSSSETVLGQLQPEKGQVTKLLEGFCEGQHAIQVFNSVFGCQNLAPLSTPQVQRLLQRPWRSFKDKDFENFLAEIFRSLGYQVMPNGKPNDKGIDLFVIVGNKKIGVQAKGYPNSVVRNDAVEAANTGRDYHRCDFCMVITNSQFTSPARDTARNLRHPCGLIDERSIPDLICGLLIPPANVLLGNIPVHDAVPHVAEPLTNVSQFPSPTPPILQDFQVPAGPFDRLDDVVDVGGRASGGKFLYTCPRCRQSYELRKAVTVSRRTCNYCGYEIQPDEVIRQDNIRAELERMARQRLLDQQQAEERRRRSQQATFTLVSVIVVTAGILACCGVGLVLTKGHSDSLPVVQQTLIRRLTTPADRRSSDGAEGPSEREKGVRKREPPSDNEATKKKKNSDPRLDPKDTATLAKLLKDTDVEKRLMAANQLEKLGPGAKEAVPGLIAALKDKEAGVRAAAAAALGRVGPDARAAFDPLVEAVKTEQAPVRAAAVRALGLIGGDAKTVCPVMVEIVKNHDDPNRKEAAQSLAKIGGGEEMIPLWLALLNDKDKELPPIAVSALEATGQLKYAHLKALVNALKNGSPSVRAFAAKAIGEIGPDAWIATRLLIKAAEGNDATTKKNAIVSIGKIGPKADEAVPVLIITLKNANLHDDAAESLVKIGKAAVPSLVDLLKGESSKRADRMDAATILGDIGPDAQAAIGALSIVAQSDQYGTVKQAARDALTKIKRKR